MCMKNLVHTPWTVVHAYYYLHLPYPRKTTLTSTNPSPPSSPKRTTKSPKSAKQHLNTNARASTSLELPREQPKMDSPPCVGHVSFSLHFRKTQRGPFSFPRSIPYLHRGTLSPNKLPPPFLAPPPQHKHFRIIASPSPPSPHAQNIPIYPPLPNTRPPNKNHLPRFIRVQYLWKSPTRSRLASSLPQPQFQIVPFLLV